MRPFVLLLLLGGCEAAHSPQWLEDKALALERENFELRRDHDTLAAEVEALRSEIEAMRIQTHKALHEAGVEHQSP